MNPQTPWLNPATTPLIIAGPCSAETEEQVLETARLLRKHIPEASYFRAGVWKPRTRPGQFEGAGAEALPWLQRVRQEFGFKLAVEIANAEHASLALEHGIDLLWLGARTTVNPFSVQEVADALAGHEGPVLVKNPINPDLGLWMGALERLERAGIRQLGAIHRGFSTTGKTPYRNEPQWHLPIELKRQMPNLPLLCDPSHIAGSRARIPELCQRALDLQMDGLMIETHPTPEAAWSDAAQQLRPEDLQEILARLVVRREKSEEISYEVQMEEYRKRIDQIDQELIHLLAERMDISRMIGHLKKRQQVTILQLKRWDEMIRSRLELAQDLGLEADFGQTLFQLIHEQSINRQNQIMNRTESPGNQ
ncbi:MAG: bifunctional 3-deoxy-7-phosphoheptulonate synthase/chorismate mutase type II [Bacteroidetes bacterium]|jgi:chorismate mutase|nr:bifunctional 3-deoxy-7-phosphoheptulonate synthase/chorismate mutase type II [Bacteroidota bacterium]